MKAQNFVHVISRDDRIVAVPVTRTLNGIALQRMFCQFTAADLLSNVPGSFLIIPRAVPSSK